MSTSTSFVVVLAAASFTVSCSSSAPTAATTAAPITAAIRQAPTAPTAPSGFTGGLCSQPTVQPARFFIGAPVFDIVITAFEPVNFSGLTLQLIDGSHVGGPTITFPQSTLSAQFGSTNIDAGSTRSFRVQPQFGCGATAPRSVVGALTFADGAGRVRVMSVSAPLE